MNIREMKRMLNNLKIHMDQTEHWVNQGMQMIYELENKLIDLEEYGFGHLLQDDDYLKNAASKMNKYFESPPRLVLQHDSRRCDNKDIVAADLNQSFFEHALN